MKILLLSDSHRNVRNMLAAVERETPDLVFHLGDLVRDAEALSEQCRSLTVLRVEGNCDAWSAPPGTPGTLIKTVGGVTFLLTHGHLYHAKSGPSALLREGRKQGVNAVLYGHTHVPLARREEDGLWLVNPGTIGGVGNRATYGLLTVEQGILSVEIRALGENMGKGASEEPLISDFADF